ncbi:TRAP transporter large permease [Lentisphaerota bacterium ZTH]|nr:TRAP transporter large permease [Lentisphaerota bacterium]WET05437.1 TRAP transporter large permease [Lentisphaerota bacterium ZTH]
MSEVIIVMLIIFVALLVLNCPVAIAISLSSFGAILCAGGEPAYTVAMRVANGVDSFALLAIPFFILSGLIMGKGSMARRLIDLAAALVGRFPGGLTYVNTLTCMMFGSISGSAAAAVSSVGGFMLPEMARKGYDRDYNVAVTATAATTGLMIPPSNIMIVYAVSAGSVSIAAMFMAGILPGIITGICIMIVGGWIAVKRGYGSGGSTSWGELLRAAKRGFLSLLLIVIIFGGILGGIFTATEAAAVAVAYAFALEFFVYRELRLKDVPPLLLKTGLTTAVVMLLIGSSSAMSWILTTQNVPQTVSDGLLHISSNPYVVLLIINLLLLAIGTFMDMTPAVLLFTPIFLPVAVNLGLSPVHFGMIMIVNLCIGLCTPPVGTCLFVGCGVGKTTIARVTGPMIPFWGAMLVALLLTTYLPFLSMWLPRILKLV